jgi:hypothetical protein
MRIAHDETRGLDCTAVVWKMQKTSQMRADGGFERVPSQKIGQKPGFPEKCQEKPQKTCGNAGFAIDKRC